MNFHISRSELACQSLELLLAEYAAGRLGRALTALVEAHLQIGAQNRAFIDSLDLTGGLLLETIDPVPLRRHGERLAAILAMPASAEPAAATAAAGVDAAGILPPALRSFIGRDFAELEWREVAPGVQQCALTGGHDLDASLVCCRAGKHLPRHGHGGLEAVLVLQGGFGDAFGHYLRGDVALADETIDHRPVCDPNEEFVAFIVRQGPVFPTDSIGGVVERLTAGRPD